jgi:DNA-binding SARP family transcriptional activator
LLARPSAYRARVVRVHATGSPCLVGDAGPVVAADLGAPQAVALLVLLAVEHRRAVPVAEITAHLWPRSVPERSELAVRALVSKLRRSLPASVTIGSALGCYQLLLPAGSTVDVEDAFAAVEQAEHLVWRGDPSAASGPALVAASIARHDLLPTWASEWAESQRRRLRDVRVRAMDCLATFFLETGDPGQAVRVTEQVVELEPYRESSYRRLMQAHVALGNRADAVRVYQQLEGRLLDDLDVTPDDETTGLLRRLTQTSARKGSGT